MYLQFDIFGAVTQIESVPIFYDNYGRISKAGEVDSSYKGENVTQIGNMNILYKKKNAYYASRGSINLESENLNSQIRHRKYERTVLTIVCFPINFYRNKTPIRYSYEEHKEKYENKESVTYDNGRRTFLDPVTKTPRKITFINNGGKYLESNNLDQRRDKVSNDRKEITRKRSTMGRRAISNSSNELNTTNGGATFSQQKSNTNNLQFKQNNKPSLQSNK